VEDEEPTNNHPENHDDFADNSDTKGLPKDLAKKDGSKAKTSEK